MAWWLEGAFPGILGGFETRQKQFFCIFLESGKKSKKKNFQEKSVFIGKNRFFRGKIGFFQKKSVFFGKIGDFSPIFFFSDFSTAISFPGPPISDFSPKNRPISAIFCSLCTVTPVGGASSGPISHGSPMSKRSNSVPGLESSFLGFLEFKKCLGG